MKKRLLALLIGSYFPTSATAFELITLGAKGGIQDGNLSAFLIKSKEDSSYISLDAGTLVNGLINAEEKGSLNHIPYPEETDLTRVGYVLKHQIQGYFISHPHLDHIAGLIIASPDDEKKPIYGLKQTNDTIASTYFNWSAWPNFGDRGEGFKLKKYQYQDMQAYTWQPVQKMNLKVMAMPLSHSGGLSTAFLLKNNQEEVFAFFGDTGPDAIEKTDRLKKSWEIISNYVKASKFKGMIIEVSYTNAQPDNMLFGHLTPNWLKTELNELEKLAGEGSLKNIPVLISHIKYSLKKADPVIEIQHQLNDGNELGIRWIIPNQGERYIFDKQ